MDWKTKHCTFTFSKRYILYWSYGWLVLVHLFFNYHVSTMSVSGYSDLKKWEKNLTAPDPASWSIKAFFMSIFLGSISKVLAGHSAKVLTPPCPLPPLKCQSTKKNNFFVASLIDLWVRNNQQLINIKLIKLGTFNIKLGTFNIELRTYNSKLGTFNSWRLGYLTVT